MLANAIHRRKRSGDEGGFTLIELIVAMAVMLIIMGTIASAFVVGLKSTNNISEDNAESADVKLMSSFFPPDVQSIAAPTYDPSSATPTAAITPDGYNAAPTPTADKPLGGGTICSGIPAAGSPTLDKGITTFGSEWDKTLGKFKKNVTYSSEGVGKDVEFVRRECGANGVTTSRATVARFFGTLLPATQQAKDLVGIECTAVECTLSVRASGADEDTYSYVLTARRRVAGGAPVPGVPCAPPAPFATPGFQQTFVQWQEPVCTGNLPITSYRVRDTPPVPSTPSDPPPSPTPTSARATARRTRTPCRRATARAAASGRGSRFPASPP